MRWASPPESVTMDLASERYSRPTFCKNPSLWRNSFKSGFAMSAQRPPKCRPFSQASSRSTDKEQNEAIFKSSTRTDNASGLSLAPWQSGQSVV